VAVSLLVGGRAMKKFLVFRLNYFFRVWPRPPACASRPTVARGDWSTSLAVLGWILGRTCRKG